ncbi:MAG: ribonuclease J [bacterium]
MENNEKLKDEIKFFALGGLSEVGKNCYCFEYRNQIFIVDAGILFPDESLLGVDYVIPDFSYLMLHQDRIKGLFITHGHEDHIGGIPFLLKQVKIDKIYAAGVAVDLIESKLKEHKDIKTKIIEYKSHFKYEFDGIDLSFIRMNHSIPDSFAFVFSTVHGHIFHTGDFKIDFTPIGPGCEYDKITKIGNEGVLCMLADSTNCMIEGWTSSETSVKKSILELFSTIKERVIVATFASNIYRVQQVVEASTINNRKIAVFGRSMEKTIEIGQEIGYIKAPKGTFIQATEINNYKPSEITILCTGSQGEPLAALSRVANGTHKHIKMMPNDTVIFSSSPIPGNQDGVNKTINNLFKRGANVIIHSPLTDTHTSGHAAAGELRFVHTVVKPKFFIPVHGEYRMQRIHNKIAVECGCPKENCFTLENGDVVSLTKDHAEISGKVKAGDIYVDGNRIGDISSQIIRERKHLSDDGLFSIILCVNKTNKRLIGEPQVVSRGFVYMRENEALTKKLVQQAKDVVISEINKQKDLNLENIKVTLKDSISKSILKETSRRPIIMVIFMEV